MLKYFILAALFSGTRLSTQNILSNSEKCGQIDPNTFKITSSGKNDLIGEFPWRVKIYKDAEKKNLLCGGSLIHPQVILTAARNINKHRENFSEIIVSAGERITDIINDTLPHQNRNISKIVIHEKNSNSLNDFALLVLTQPFILSNNVNIVCLPNPEENFDGRGCWTRKWNRKFRLEENVYDWKIDEQVAVQILPHYVCQKSLRNTNHRNYKVPQSIICAGDKVTKDGGNGRRGNPLVCLIAQETNRYVQVGIVSWDIGIIAPGYYGNIANARLWIDRKMYEFGFDDLLYVYSPAKKIMDAKPSLKTQSCGQRHRDGEGLNILKLNETYFGEFPWMVAILRNYDGQWNYDCGGSLIHPRVILTAAACVKSLTSSLTGKEIHPETSPSDLIVRVGDWDQKIIIESLPHQDRNVSRIIVHESANRPLFTHEFNDFDDFALLVLSESVTLAENVGTICLPDSKTNFNESRCFVIGWGNGFLGKMKQFETSIAAHNACQKSLRESFLGKNFMLNHRLICAGDQAGEIFFKYFEGSPLVCSLSQEKNRFVQTGTFSWAVDRGERRFPPLFGNVTRLRMWIDRQMEILGLDNSSYNSNRF